MPKKPTTLKEIGITRPIIIASVILLLLAFAITQDIFLFNVLFFSFCYGITLGIQVIIGHILKRWPVRPIFRTTLLIIPPVTLTLLSAIFLNPVARDKSAIRVALGTEPPAEMKDLHVFESAFTDYVVFAYFSCSSNSIEKLISNPIYKLENYKREHDLSDRKDWPDLQYLGLVTNMSVYSRTDIARETGGGQIHIDPEYRFVIVSYGVD